MDEGFGGAWGLRSWDSGKELDGVELPKTRRRIFADENGIGGEDEEEVERSVGDDEVRGDRGVSEPCDDNNMEENS